MANRIVLKRSSVANRVPLASDLVAGELAVNLTDKLLYTKDAAGNVVAVGGSGGGGSGTVTAVSVTTANGVSGTVATSTTTPAISIALGAITPTSVAASGQVTGSNLSGTNTGDQSLASLGAYAASNPNGYTSNTGTVTGVTATSPVVSSGGTAPVISMAAANTSTPGYLTAADWNTFNGKQSALGYTPYNSSNPSGFTSNTGTVTSVAGTGTVSGLTLSGTVTASGNLTLGGTLSLTSGNVTTALGYTPYNSSNPSGYITSSGSISGNAATATTSNRSTIEDTRASQRTPNAYDDYRASYEFTNQITGASDWHTAFTMQGWHDGYSAWQIIGPASTSAHENFYLRSGVNTSWNTLRTILHSGNYTSYSPSLTGSGASGTWGINITGNAATINSQANSATITASSGINGSQIVQRDGNGYIYANHINFSTSESENPTINSFITGNGDGWSRKSSLAHVKNSIRGVADGTWGINVTGSAGSAGSATWAANVYLNSSSSYLIGGSVWAGTGGYPGYQYTGGNHRFGFSSTSGYIDVYTDGYFYCGIDPTGGNRLVLFEDTWLNNKHFGSDGNIYSNASMRATIFYDQNDTSYFVDGNSSSTLRTITNRGWLYINEDYGHSVVGTYASTRLQGVFAMGDSYKLPASGIGGGSLYGIAWSHPNAGGVAGNLNTHGALLLENGGYLCALSGSIRCRDDMRTPIYYDANDTGYFVDPNGTSRLANRLYLHNWIEFVNYYGLYSPNNGAHFYPNDASYGSWRVAGSRNGWSGLEFDASNGQQSMMVSTSGTTIGWHNNSYGWKFQWEGGRMYCWDSTYGGGPQRMLLMQDTWQGSKYFGSDGAMYGTILYDSNNSGYYCDPNNTSRMNAVVADNLYAYGTVTAYYSDDRLKTRFSNIADALDKVCSLNGFFYVGNSVAESLGYKKKMEVGLSAQEVQRILPEVVVPAPVDENYLTIQYDRVVPLLVEAIKELRLELNQLKSLVKL